jgi:hypothetical protein
VNDYGQAFTVTFVVASAVQMGPFVSSSRSTRTW